MKDDAAARARAHMAEMHFYGLRDDFARIYKPANSFEVLMLSQVTRAFVRYQRAQDAEDRYLEQNPVLHAVCNRYREYKAITGNVAVCERAWRSAVRYLEKIQCGRRKTQRCPEARRREEPLPEPQFIAAVPGQSNPDVPFDSEVRRN